MKLVSVCVSLMGNKGVCVSVGGLEVALGLLKHNSGSDTSRKCSGFKP